MYSIARRVVAPFLGRQSVPAVAGLRFASGNARKRQRAFRRASEDPHTSPTKLKKLRERCASPSHDLLRHLAENKIGKAMTTADRRALWFDLQYRRYSPQFLGQWKPRMQLWTAALSESQLPLPRLPEVAIAGRSNSGKSTLVNYLCGRHSAHVKRMPGSTTELVFWKIGRPAQLCLVDLPGYGFAMAPEERRLQWTEFTLWYVRSRRNLRRVLLLIDARQGLKPSDKEMISYLERYGVGWQIVVTKCDKVVPKDLARRLAVLEEDTADYHKMAGRPIPVSALKRKGMQTLRETLDSLKVMKEVVKEGIRRRVFDLLELRRCRRSERARRKREAKAEEARRQEAAEAAAAEAAAAEGDGPAAADGEDARSGAGPGPGREDLHAILDEWRGEDGGEAPAFGTTEDAQPSPKPLVAELHYGLDDRDSRRIDSFVHSLFPELPGTPCAHPELRAAEHPPLVHAPDPGGFDGGGAVRARLSGVLHSGAAASSRLHVKAPLGGDVDSESDDDEVGVPMPRVQRFDPVPVHARGRAEVPSPLKDGAFSPFPAIGAPKGAPGRPGAGAAHVPGTTSTLLPSWIRSAPGQDKIYSEDDFASADDVASGKRRFAPESPTAETSGRLLADARRRYEREWAMELESVEEARRGAEDVGRSGPSAAPRARRRGAPEPQEAEGQALGARRGGHGILPYIGKNGNKPIPSGRGRWRILGRPPAKILKRRQEADVGKVFGLRSKKHRRRNLGSGLDWEDAKEKWVNWYHRNKRSNFDRVQAAASPKKQDVEEAYEERKRMLQRRGRRTKPRSPKDRDEAAEPDMDV